MPESDKELLEQAANATGHEWRWVTAPRYGATPLPGMKLHDSVNNVDYWPAWNPLEDDGDALRLAVKLKIELTFDSESNLMCAEACDSLCNASYEVTNPDAFAATRRAIVRAAAGLGKGD